MELATSAWRSYNPFLTNTMVFIAETAPLQTRDVNPLQSGLTVAIYEPSKDADSGFRDGPSPPLKNECSSTSVSPSPPHSPRENVNPLASLSQQENINPSVHQPDYINLSLNQPENINLLLSSLLQPENIIQLPSLNQQENNENVKNISVNENVEKVPVNKNAKVVPADAESRGLNVAYSEHVALEAKFDSFDHFERVFELWKQTYYHPFRTASSETMKDDNGNIHQKYRYKYIVFHCKHYGKPRRRGKGKRPNQHYMPKECGAMLRLNYSYSEKVLKITTLVTNHNHEISAELYHKSCRAPRQKGVGKVKSRARKAPRQSNTAPEVSEPSNASSPDHQTYADIQSPAFNPVQTPPALPDVSSLLAAALNISNNAGNVQLPNRTPSFLGSQLLLNNPMLGNYFPNAASPSPQQFNPFAGLNLPQFPFSPPVQQLPPPQADQTMMNLANFMLAQKQPQPVVESPLSKFLQFVTPQNNAPVTPPVDDTVNIRMNYFNMINQMQNQVADNPSIMEQILKAVQPLLGNNANNA